MSYWIAGCKPCNFPVSEVSGHTSLTCFEVAVFSAESTACISHGRKSMETLMHSSAVLKGRQENCGRAMLGSCRAFGTLRRFVYRNHGLVSMASTCRHFVTESVQLQNLRVGFALARTDQTRQFPQSSGLKKLHLQDYSKPLNVSSNVLRSSGCQSGNPHRAR